MAHALNKFYCRGALGAKVDPDTIGCVWRGELDLSGEIKTFFNPERKSCGLKKYLDTCGQGLTLIWIIVVKNYNINCKLVEAVYTNI